MSSRLPEEHQPNQPDANPRHIRVPGSDRIYDRNKILLVLLVPLTMSLLQVSSVNNVLFTVGKALDASSTQLQWVLSGYALCFGILLVPAGRIGDLFGRSSAFVVGLSVFTLASLLVGLSTSAIMLNMMRCLQGIGAGMYSPQITGLILHYFTGHARAKAFSLFGLIISASVAAGPLMSGSLISLLGPQNGWRWSFIINFPFGLIGIFFALRWLPFGKERRHVGKRAKEARREYIAMRRKEGVVHKPRTRIDLDPLGSFLLVLSVLCIMLPFMTHGHMWFWFLLPVGFLLIVVWVLWEKFYAAHEHEPMVDLRLFRIKTFSYGSAISAAQFMGTTSIFVVLAMFLQNALDASALEVGLVSLPDALIAAYAAIWSGKRAVEHGRGVQVMALTLMLVGILGVTTVVWAIEHGLSFWWLTIPLTILGFGQGCMGAANQTQSMIDVPPEHGGTAGGVQQTGQRITTAIGNAVITAIFWLGPSLHTGNTGWYVGFFLAYMMVTLFILLALTLAILFWRDGYHDRHPRQDSARNSQLRRRSAQRLQRRSIRAQ
ncbi:MFS transporter [Trueperella sp. LYQ143]|uniref:MFS transporter n=1 Tax=unclassified Trueperella TaxID=2630174 RepID=UPI0039833CD4